MNKFFRAILLCALTTAALAVSAHASDTLKVGLYYGGSALFSANLQNYQGSGYALGWFDEESRRFREIGWLEEEKISMTADGNIYISGGAYYQNRPAGVDAAVGGYHVEMDESFADFEEAKYVADQFRTGFVAFINNDYRVRVDHFTSREEAEAAAATYATYTWYDLDGREYSFSGEVVSPSATGVTITETTTDHILFEFDCSGAKSLGILPDGRGREAETWFKGYRWLGGFEYRRSTGGNINVINVVDVDDYVRGVLPYEMNPQWPMEALKAQAVCARTYALRQTKHYKSYKFDVCNTTDCQVYYGTNQASALTDRAALETAGVVAMYDGDYAETYYCSSNGGASESSENVWTTALPYLRGKEDPYEATISIPGYAWSVHYTYDQLTRVLQQKGYSIGDVVGVYVSRTTPTGNVAEVTFTDSRGRSVTVAGDKCRTVFYTTLFGGTKSVKSLRYTISGGGSGGGFAVNSGGSIPGLDGAYAITGSGELDRLEGGEAYAVTPQGTVLLEAREPDRGDSDGITITGTGSGHQVGLSQYGAKAMAELGYTYEEILDFYFTGIDLEMVG